MSGKRQNYVTWREVMPEPIRTITREDVLDELQRKGYTVGSGQLLHWQEVGAIPYGVRAWRNGRVFVDYPWYWPGIVEQLILLQKTGVSLRQMADSRVFWTTPSPRFEDAKLCPCPFCNGSGIINAAASHRDMI